MIFTQASFKTLKEAPQDDTVKLNCQLGMGPTSLCHIVFVIVLQEHKVLSPFLSQAGSLAGSGHSLRVSFLYFSGDPELSV